MNQLIPCVVNVRYMKDPSGTSTSLHRHNYVQAGLILRGTLFLKLPDCPRARVEPGEFFCVAQYQPHIIFNTPPHAPESIDLRFKCRDTGNTGSLRPNVPGLKFTSVMAGESFIMKLGKNSKSARLLHTMGKWHAAPPEAGGFVLLQYLLQFAAMLEKLPRRRLAKIREVPSEHYAVREALRIIHTDFARPLTESDVARQAGISLGHLSRLFQRHVQMGFKQYLLRHRVEIAKQFLLHNEHMPVKEIAWRAGFGDQQQFSRIFRRFEGCSPSEFRV